MSRISTAAAAATLLCVSASFAATAPSTTESMQMWNNPYGSQGLPLSADQL